MLRLSTFLVILILPLSSFASGNFRIVGSSTVYPFISLLSEEVFISYNHEFEKQDVIVDRFAKYGDISRVLKGKYGKINAPIIESVGTGNGFKSLCDGDEIDLVIASREMKRSEEFLCKKNNTLPVDNNGKIVRFNIGYDAISLVSSRRSKKPIRNLSLDELFRALAYEVPVDGKLVPNPYVLWSDINPDLPDRKIIFYGPSTSSGTRDSLMELGMLPACKKYFDLYEEKYGQKAEKACEAIRVDGAYVDVGENDNISIRKSMINKNAIAILGLSYYVENKNAVEAIAINSKKPQDRGYNLLRSLFIYPSKSLLNATYQPEVSQNALFFMYILNEFQSGNASGKDGYLTDNSLIPMMHDDKQAMIDFLHSVIQFNPS